MFFAEAIQNAAHQMKRAKGMCKARVFRTLIRVKSQPELLDTPQSLKLRRVYQTHHQFAFASVGSEANDVMDRVAIYSFRQDLGSFEAD